MPGPQPGTGKSSIHVLHVGAAPAVLDGRHGVGALALQQRQGPVQVVPVQPVVVDGQRVLQVLHAVMPAAGQKDRLPRLLQDVTKPRPSSLELASGAPEARLMDRCWTPGKEVCTHTPCQQSALTPLASSLGTHPAVMSALRPETHRHCELVNKKRCLHSHAVRVELRCQAGKHGCVCGEAAEAKTCHQKRLARPHVVPTS